MDPAAILVHSFDAEKQFLAVMADSFVSSMIVEEEKKIPKNLSLIHPHL
jgi:hypothetical protein